jgi:5-methylcytosine-specific restriction protein A
MPTRARRPCPNVEGGRSCPHLQPCPVHVKRAWDHGGRTRQARGYDAQHEQLRRQVMAEEPGCRVCGGTGPGTADHIVPLSQGGRTERSNMQRLCKKHQASKAGREGAAARQAAT